MGDSTGRSVELSALFVALGFYPSTLCADSAKRSIRNERLETLSAVNKQRIETLDTINQQRIETLDFLTREKTAIIDALENERKIVLEVLESERHAVLNEVESMGNRIVQDGIKELDKLIDHFFLRAAQLVGICLIISFCFGGVGIYMIGRKRQAPQM